MHILFVATVYNHLAAFHKPFIKYFQDKGYMVHVAGSDSMGRKAELEQLGVICHDISFDKNIFSGNNKKAIDELKALFSEVNFKLIHVHTPIAAFLVRFVLRKNNSQGALLYTAHGFHFFKGAPLKNWLFFYLAEKMAKYWTDGLLVMNQEDLSLAQQMGFVLNENLFMVDGVGVDLAEFNEKVNAQTEKTIRDELGLSQEELIVSCVAELSHRKNQMFLLENWTEIHKKNPDLNLLLIGEGADAPALKGYVDKENLKKVHFLGFRRDMPKILAETDIVTLTSLHEGLPRCLMEAVVLGKPMIATDVRGSRDIVNDCENGYLINLGNNELLTERITSLSLDNDLRKKFGDNAKRDLNKYSLENVLIQMDRVYMKFLNK